MTYQVLEGDCVEVMRGMDAESVDAVVCDPPYGLEFMGKEWDRLGDIKRANRGTQTTWKRPEHENSKAPKFQNDAPAFDLSATSQRKMQAWHEAWAREALRVLKPGGHLLAFGGTRTYHRLVCAIEDAGFEVRDTVQWIYGSGFPKSLNVGKAIDKTRGDGPRIAEVASWLRDKLNESGKKRSEIDAHFGTANVSQYWFSPEKKAEVPPWAKWLWLKSWLGFSDEMDSEVWRLNGMKGKPGEAWGEREVLGKSDELLGRKSGIGNEVNGHYTVGGTKAEAYAITAPATEAAKQWEGWGTALKPAHEPIVLARKPLAESSVARQVLSTGTGALAIDKCRVNGTPAKGGAGKPGANFDDDDYVWKGEYNPPNPSGRWPANLLLSHSPQCVRTGEVRRVKGDYARKGNLDGRTYNEHQEWGLKGKPGPDHGFVDPDGTEAVEAWECHPSCPVRLMDEQSGQSKSGGYPPAGGQRSHVATYGKPNERGEQKFGASEGGASRFFQRFEGSPEPGFVCEMCGTPDRNGPKSGIMRECQDHGKSASLDPANDASGPSTRIPTGADSAQENARVSSATRNEHASTAESTTNPNTGGNGSAPTNALVHAPHNLGGKAQSVATNAHSAGNGSGSGPVTVGGIAPENVPPKLEEQLVRRVSDAASLCKKCTTAIARSLAQAVADRSMSIRGLDSITCSNVSILGQSLAAFVEPWAKSGTIPTTQSLSILFGYVIPAMRISTAQDTAGDLSGHPGFLYKSKASRAEKSRGLEGMPEHLASVGNKEAAGGDGGKPGNALPGGAGDRVERGLAPTMPRANNHPTVKPIALMRYLVRLITQPGGTVLDPFAGSGSTGCAAALEGFDFIGIEREAEYAEIARRRIAHWSGDKTEPAKPEPLTTLF